MRKELKLFILFFLPIISFGQSNHLGASNEDAASKSSQVVATNVNLFLMENGCTYAQACNYNEFATIDDGSCEFSSCFSFGCTYTNALNFNPESDFDDGSCVFEGLASDCANDFNNDAVVNASDLNLLLGGFGTNCE